MRASPLVLMLTSTVLAASSPAARSPAPAWAAYGRSEAVRIESYAGEAMEPFISRDGRVLVFNNRNDPPERTDLYWAERVDDATWRFRGPVAGANSTTLDGVGTISVAGRFCFVSLRTYAHDQGSVWCGDWQDGRVEHAALQAAVSDHVPGRLVFDVEIAADGQSLVVAHGRYLAGPVPLTADLRLARRRADGSFALSPADDALFARVNTSALEYAAALSSDGLRLAFTRAQGLWPFLRTSLWIAVRPTTTAPFGDPVRIAAADGDAVEGPAFSPDNRSLYYHRRVRGRYGLWRVSLPLSR